MLGGFFTLYLVAPAISIAQDVPNLTPQRNYEGREAAKSLGGVVVDAVEIFVVVCIVVALGKIASRTLGNKSGGVGPPATAVGVCLVVLAVLANLGSFLNGWTGFIHF
jgi:hypothetical protein